MSEKIIGQITTTPNLQGNIQKETYLQGKLGYGSYELNKDYNKLANKPSIEGIELIDDKTFEDLGATGLTNLEIENLLNLQV